MSTFSEAYAAQRAHLETHVVRGKKKRRPVAVMALGYLGSLLARGAAWYPRARRVVLYTAGFGFLDFAAWSWNHVLGYAAIGISLLVLDALSGGDDKR